MAIDDSLRMRGLPKPEYLDNSSDVNLDKSWKSRKWIGVQTNSIDNTIKDFFWWRNFEFGDLNNYDSRNEAVSFLTSLYFRMGVEATIGKAINILKSNPEKNIIKTMNEPDIYGVYIQSNKRRLFEFKFLKEIEDYGKIDESAIKLIEPDYFNEIYEKFHKILPYNVDTIIN